MLYGFDGKEVTVPMIEPPEWIRRLDVYEVEAFHRKFWTYCYRAREKFGENPCGEFIWPSKGVSARALPGGIHPLGPDEGFDHEERIERFFNDISPDGMAFWGHRRYAVGTFLGPCNTAMRAFVDRELIMLTWCAVSPTAHLAMVIERDWEASLVMGSQEVIDHLDFVFGGPEKLRQAFVDHVERGDFADHPRFSSWAYEHIFPKCGWSVS
jgi:hypothetical protein